MHSAPQQLASEPGDDGSVDLERRNSAVLEAQYHEILEWLTHAHFTVDGAWRFVEVSPRAAEFLGFPEDALLGRLMWDVFPVALGTPFEQESRAAMQSRLPRRCQEYFVEPLGLLTDVLFCPDTRGLRVYYRERSLNELNPTLEQRVAERTAEVQQQADQLRELTAELARGEHRERRRLALVLHDHVQQLLVAAKMQVEAIGRRAVSKGVTSAAERTSSVLRDAIAASRTLSVELSPPVLHHSGLAAGLAWLAGHFDEKHGFKVHFRDKSQGETTTEEVRLLLFDSARELLFNCIKHSGVREAKLTLSQTNSRQLQLVVEDKGRGFAPPPPSSRNLNRRSLGLFGIQQRLAYVGGRMEIEGAPGAGVRVILIGPPGPETA